MKVYHEIKLIAGVEDVIAFICESITCEKCILRQLKSTIKIVAREKWKGY